jgi:hypothetical protein
MAMPARRGCWLTVVALTPSSAPGPALGVQVGRSLNVHRDTVTSRSAASGSIDSRWTDREATAETGDQRRRMSAATPQNSSSCVGPTSRPRSNRRKLNKTTATVISVLGAARSSWPPSGRPGGDR